MSGMAVSTVAKAILVLGVVLILAVAGITYIKPLVDAFLGVDILSNVQKVEAGSSFDFFVKQYQECKAGNDNECLCSSSVVVPRNVVLKIENNKQLKQTEFSLLKGKILEGDHPVYDGEGEKLSDRPKEELLVKNDLLFVAADAWEIVKRDDKTVLDSSKLESVQDYFLAEGSNCNPCLYISGDADSQVKTFDPGYLYKIDDQRMVLVSERMRIGGSGVKSSLSDAERGLVHVSGGREDVAKLTKCGKGKIEGKLLFEDLLSNVEKCLMFKPYAVEYLSEEYLVNVGKDPDAQLGFDWIGAGVKYRVDRYGNSKWELTSYWLLLEGVINKETEGALKDARIKKLDNPSGKRRALASSFVSTLQKKNAEAGLDVINKKGFVRINSINSGETELTQIIFFEKNQLKKSVPVAAQCASLEFFANGVTRIPQGYTISLNNGLFTLLKSNQVVFSSPKLPVSVCKLKYDDASSESSLLTSLSADQKTVRWNLYQYPTETMCVYTTDVKASQTEIIERVAGQFSEVKNG
ncbi:MAG: hypothetical protein WC595_05825 [Candidatus Nanoarchaeia archaeon]